MFIFRTFVFIFILLTLCGCSIESTMHDRPVEVMPVGHGEMFCIQTESKVYLILDKELVKNKKLNTLTESDLARLIPGCSAKITTKIK